MPPCSTVRRASRPSGRWSTWVARDGPARYRPSRRPPVAAPPAPPEPPEPPSRRRPRRPRRRAADGASTAENERDDRCRLTATSANAASIVSMIVARRGCRRRRCPHRQRRRDRRSRRSRRRPRRRHRRTAGRGTARAAAAAPAPLIMALVATPPTAMEDRRRPSRRRRRAAGRRSTFDRPPRCRPRGSRTGRPRRVREPERLRRRWRRRSLHRLARRRPDVAEAAGGDRRAEDGAVGGDRGRGRVARSARVRPLPGGGQRGSPPCGGGVARVAGVGGRGLARSRRRWRPRIARGTAVVVAARPGAPLAEPVATVGPAGGDGVAGHWRRRPAGRTAPPNPRTEATAAPKPPNPAPADVRHRQAAHPPPRGRSRTEPWWR